MLSLIMRSQLASQHLSNLNVSKLIFSRFRNNFRLYSTQSPKKHDIEPMSWNEFFALRKQRRLVGTLTSLGTCSASTILAYQYFANQVIDFNKTIAGIEIQYIYIGGILASGVLGWLIGPYCGDKLFDLKLGSKRNAFTEMDGTFLRHVAKNRPDPTKNNVNYNPLTDYYGEKITCVHEYRKWLRKCHLFTKRAERFF